MFVTCSHFHIEIKDIPRDTYQEEDINTDREREKHLALHETNQPGEK